MADATTPSGESPFFDAPFLFLGIVRYPICTYVIVRFRCSVLLFPIHKLVNNIYAHMHTYIRYKHINTYKSDNMTGYPSEYVIGLS